MTFILHTDMLAVLWFNVGRLLEILVRELVYILKNTLGKMYLFIFLQLQ